MRKSLFSATYSLTLGASLLFASLEAQAYEPAVLLDRETAIKKDNRQIPTRLALGWLLGAAGRGAAGVATSGLVARGALAAPRMAPYLVRPYVYNYRPNYYKPNFAPAVHLQYGGPSGYVDASNRSQQRQCWATGSEIILVNGGGYITRYHYRCSYR
jgi:hypothetical protein